MKIFANVFFLASLILFLATPDSTFAQREEPYTGGFQALTTLIGKNMKYPAADMANRIQGKVILRFKIVNKALDSVVVVNHVSPGLDAEATRVMLLTSGQWNLEENKTFLFALVFKLTADGVQSMEKLRADRDKAMQGKEYANALKYAGEIQRRDPFDIANLDMLEEICTYFNAEDAKKQVIELKSQLLTIPLITKF